MAEFFNMGGYAEFVWPSYGLVAVILWLNWYLPRLEHRKLLSQLKRKNQSNED
jgi:heme exporter protein D